FPCTINRCPRLNTRSRYGWLNHTALRKPLESRSSTWSGTRDRPLGGGLTPAITPVLVPESPGARFRNATNWVRSSCRAANWKSASATVTSPIFARSFARCGPTPFTYWSGVPRPCWDGAPEALVPDLGRGKELPRLAHHAIKRGRVRQTTLTFEESGWLSVAMSAERARPWVTRSVTPIT